MRAPLTKTLLQASVVGLGFGMDLHRVLSAGAQGFIYTAGGIAFALTAGWALGRLLNVEKTISYLVSVGTAICGGSAIAAVGPVIGADAEQMSVALGTVFLLNSIALLLFPPIGRALGLSQTQFGFLGRARHPRHEFRRRSGHEVRPRGSGRRRHREAGARPLDRARLPRRPPPSNRSKAKIQWPWFILFFVLAAAANTFLPAGAGAWRFLNAAGKAGLTATLFLIGAGLSRAALRRVGPRPLIQGVALWALVGTLSLALIRAGIVR